MQTHSSSSSLHTNEGPPLPPAKKPKQSTAGKKVFETKCEWSAEEEERLIVFLLSEIASAADGGNFKQVTWNAAVVEIDCSKSGPGPRGPGSGLDRPHGSECPGQ